MIDTSSFDEIAKRLAESLPPGFQQFREEMQKNFQAMLQSAFSKMNLVSREEFEVQQAVLLKTREKLEQLEAQVAELEQRITPT